MWLKCRYSPLTYGQNTLTKSDIQQLKLKSFFSSGMSPCLVMDQHQQKCQTRFLPLQAANSLFEENSFCKVRHLHFVTLCLHSYTLRVVFFYHSQFIFCQHGVFQNWIKGINAEKFFSNICVNFVLVVQVPSHKDIVHI